MIYSWRMTPLPRRRRNFRTHMHGRTHARKSSLFTPTAAKAACTLPFVYRFQAAKVSSRAVGGGRDEIRRDRSSRTHDLDRPAAFRDDPRPASCRTARYRYTYMWTDESGRSRAFAYYSIGCIYLSAFICLFCYDM